MDEEYCDDDREYIRVVTKTDPFAPRKEGEYPNDTMQTTTYTRKKLQGLAEEKRIRDEAQALAQKQATMRHYVQQITPCVVRAAEESKTSYLYTLPQTPNRCSGIQGIGSHPTTEDLVEALRESFPSCTVEAVEEWVDHVGRGNLRGVHTRILTSGIKIDWS